MTGRHLEARSRSATRSHSTSARSSRPGSAYGPAGNEYLHSGSLLVQEWHPPTWSDYVKSVDQICDLFGTPSTEVQAWRASVVKPFENNWDTFDLPIQIGMYSIVNRRRELLAEQLPAHHWHPIEVLFRGFVVSSFPCCQLHLSSQRS